MFNNLNKMDIIIRIRLLNPEVNTFIVVHKKADYPHSQPFIKNISRLPQNKPAPHNSVYY